MALSHYKSFCQEYDVIYRLPITTDHIVMFIAFLKNKTLAARTISTYVSAISFIHRINQWPDPTNSFLIGKLLQFIHRHKNVDSRLPITTSILDKLVNALMYTVSSKYDQILLVSMFTLAYHALLRIGEMTINNNNSKNVLHLNQLEVTNIKLVIIFINFKHSEGKTFRLEVLKHENNKICALTALKSYLAVRGKKSGPLFINAKGTAVSRQFFQSALNDALAFCGLDKTLYKSHSFRIGFATEACAKGYSSEMIRTLGRWKSDAYKVYLRQSHQISNIQ